MDIQVKISAPELSEAIKALAIALSSKTAMSESQMKTETITPPQQTQSSVSQNKQDTEPQQIPVATAQAVSPISAPPVASQQIYTLEEVAKAAALFAETGDVNRQKVLDLLSRFNVSQLNLIPQEQLGAFVTELRTLGARI